MAWVQLNNAGVVVIKSYPQPADLTGWIDAPDDVAPGMRRVDGAFTAPPPAPADRVAEIDDRLADLDAAAIRPLRAIQAHGGEDADRARLDALEDEATRLRAERARLAAEADAP